MGRELVDEPGDAGRRMAHNRGRDARFLDRSVFRKCGRNPAYIDIKGANDATAQNNRTIGGVIGDGIDNGAWNFGAIINDFKRRRHIGGSLHDIVHLAARALQIRAHDKGQLCFKPGFDEGACRNTCAIFKERIIKHHAIIRLSDF